jgi:crotonobetainyl-CoA:carnitine CoA-transferase CaiB-like acyl-CoA transferase
MLGEHNEVVLKEKLGLTDDEIQSLSDQKIIGTVPII